MDLPGISSLLHQLLKRIINRLGEKYLITTRKPLLETSRTEKVDRNTCYLRTVHETISHAADCPFGWVPQ